VESLLLTFGTVKLQWHTVLLSFLFAFVLSSVIATVYKRTFAGLSWSRGILQAMVLGSLISCLLMIAIGDNVARGIGIVGSLAVIRFRTNFREPRDLVFIFAALGAGVASGVQSYMAAGIGTGLFCLIALAMNTSAFGSLRRHDGLIRLQVPAGPEAAAAVAGVMRELPKSFALITQRQVAQGAMMDCAYQVKLARDGDVDRLLAALGAIDGVRGLSWMNHETTVEV